MTAAGRYIAACFRGTPRTTAGAITEFIVPIAYSVVGSIATGPDGAMWFTTIDTIVE